MVRFFSIYKTENRCEGSPSLQKSLPSNAGYSLIEILIATAMMGILLAIAIASLSSSKTDATEAASSGSLQNLNVALYRAYKKGDPQFLENGYLHKDSTNSINAVAYLIQAGYIQ